MKPLLLPSPRRAEWMPGKVEAPAVVRVRAVPGLSAELRALSIRFETVQAGGADVEPSFDRSMATQEYELCIGGAGPSIRLRAGGVEGVRHGLATLAQLLRQFGRALPAGEVRDAPAFAVRGVMLDVSRCRVPTMEHLFETVDLLASLKFNHLQFYTEHAFAYAGHEEVWRGCSPLTPAEVRTLDEHCRERGIELAANQNCFGHMARWLKHERYSQLAETHGDWMFDVWPRSGPFSLCPANPGSLALVEDLLGQLLPCFTSPLVNIGCDETFDVGFGRSKAEVEQRGRAAVYAEFVSKVAAIARRHAKRSLFWADIALRDPEALALFPRDMTALAWGYEPETPFARWREAVEQAGLSCWACPGTSSWCSITGRAAERRANLAAAASSGCAGFLLTDWGDFGHHQQWPITLAALAQGAEAAWSGSVEHSDAAASLFVLGDPSLECARWLDELGDCDLALREVCGRLTRPSGGPRLMNQSALFADCRKGMAEALDVGPVHLWEETRSRLLSLQRRRPAAVGELIGEELDQSLRCALFAASRAICRRRGASTQDSAELAELKREVIEEHRRLWPRRSREGGLDESRDFYSAVEV